MSSKVPAFQSNFSANASDERLACSSRKRRHDALEPVMPASLSARDRREIARRSQILARFNALVAGGLTRVMAARRVRRSLPTLWRWAQALDATGLAGLGTRYGNCGRRSPFAQVKLSALALREIEQLILTQGSQRAAWLQFGRSAACPPAVARFIGQHGRAPELLIRRVQLKPVPSRAFVSGDGRRVFVRVKGGRA